MEAIASNFRIDRAALGDGERVEAGGKPCRWYADGAFCWRAARDRRFADQIRTARDAGALGGAARYAAAIDGSLSRLGRLLREPASIRELLLGPTK